jgi:hypothetical protein
VAFDELRLVHATARILRVQPGISSGDFGAGPTAAIAAAPLVAFLLVPPPVLVVASPGLPTGAAGAGFDAAVLPLFLLSLLLALVAPSLVFRATLRRAHTLLTKNNFRYITGLLFIFM